MPPLRHRPPFPPCLVVFDLPVRQIDEDRSRLARLRIENVDEESALLKRFAMRSARSAVAATLRGPQGRGYRQINRRSRETILRGERR